MGWRVVGGDLFGGDRLLPDNKEANLKISFGSASCRYLILQLFRVAVFSAFLLVLEPFYICEILTVRKRRVLREETERIFV